LLLLWYKSDFRGEDIYWLIIFVLNLSDYICCIIIEYTVTRLSFFFRKH